MPGDELRQCFGDADKHDFRLGGYIGEVFQDLCHARMSIFIFNTIILINNDQARNIRELVNKQPRGDLLSSCNASKGLAQPPRSTDAHGPKPKTSVTFPFGFNPVQNDIDPRACQHVAEYRIKRARPLAAYEMRMLLVSAYKEVCKCCKRRLADAAFPDKGDLTAGCLDLGVQSAYMFYASCKKLGKVNRRKWSERLVGPRQKSYIGCSLR